MNEDKKITLYHGSPLPEFIPTYGLGSEHHDYGSGFYLTDSHDLACEWSVSFPGGSNGFVHKYELDLTELNILDFRNYSPYVWLAELMKHRIYNESKRTRKLAAEFIQRFGLAETEQYDLIVGWRANASYFYIAKAFMRDEFDVELLEELLQLGDLGIQYCIKSQKAYSALKEIPNEMNEISFKDFNPKYLDRDTNARRKMKKLIESDRNTVSHVFSDLMKE